MKNIFSPKIIEIRVHLIPVYDSLSAEVEAPNNVDLLAGTSGTLYFQELRNPNLPSS